MGWWDIREVAGGFLVLGLLFCQEAGEGHDLGIDALLAHRPGIVVPVACHSCLYLLEGSVVCGIAECCIQDGLKKVEKLEVERRNVLGTMEALCRLCERRQKWSRLGFNVNSSY